MILNRILRFLLSILGGLLGYLLILSIRGLGFLSGLGPGTMTVIYIIGGMVTAIIFYLIFPFLFRWLKNLADNIEGSLRSVPTSDILSGVMGLIIGLFIAFLISQPLYNLRFPYIDLTLSVILSILLYIGFGYLGIRIATRNKEDMITFLTKVRTSSKDKDKDREKGDKKSPYKYKLFDSSVVIDGRIADIIKAGFLEGPFVIPEFVLEELQHIADSENNLRRQRGRRGLDVIKTIQDEKKEQVIIHSEKYFEIPEVDSKLLKLAKDLNAKIITNDYNLNKVADVKGIEVLNINELANAMKPVVIPGEEMEISIIKDGKESNQGLAYLDDGTMIVVEDGRKHIGKTIEVIVTSVLQTAAGKMIFAKPK